MNTNEKILKLREVMEENDISVYIITSTDPHQSEYLPEHYRSRIWLSGFSGGAGTLVVSKDKAILWTDGRYFTQAENEIEGTEIELFKMNIPGFPTYPEWIRDNLIDGDTIGFDGKLLSRETVEELEKMVADKKISFNDEHDLVDYIWTDRPAVPSSEVFLFDAQFTGTTAREKIDKVRKIMKEKNTNYYLISTLDDIAWVYNIRGWDIPNNPMTLSYGLITLNEAFLCIDKNKINDEIVTSMNNNGITIRDYNDIINLVKEIPHNSTVLLDKSKVNNWLFAGLKDEVIVKNEINITSNLKAVKNEVEIKNQKNAYIKDGLAMTKLLYWLDSNIEKMEITEYDVSQKLEEFRKENDQYKVASFITIAAYEANAAMMHYRPKEDASSVLEGKGTFLLDAGGQYLDGTTDTTRTVALGKISDEQRKDFTLTLMSHINLIGSRFLRGTTGYQLDAIARYPMWQEGLDYKCGTGHGVGFFLSVHEGPHRIAPINNEVALEEGMIVTIEPGVYKPGKHGIRIENVGLVRKDCETDSGEFYSFEILSFVPIDTSCLEKSILSLRDINWLNNYHKTVYDKLSPYLSQDIKQWLKEKTKEI